MDAIGKRVYQDTRWLGDSPPETVFLEAAKRQWDAFDLRDLADEIDAEVLRLLKSGQHAQAGDRLVQKMIYAVRWRVIAETT